MATLLAAMRLWKNGGAPIAEMDWYPIPIRPSIGSSAQSAESVVAAPIDCAGTVSPATVTDSLNTVPDVVDPSPYEIENVLDVETDEDDLAGL